MIGGYGSTETCGVITTSIFGDLVGNNVGPPLPICEIKLVDVPGMGLIANRDNRGEVCPTQMTFFRLLIFVEKMFSPTLQFLNFNALI